MSPLLILLAAAAASAPPPPATRAEVAAQRVAVEQRFARESADCEQRFAVSPCLEDLRKRRQEALAPLIRHEHRLAAEERLARAAAQTQRVKERELAAVQEQGQRGQRLVAQPTPAPPASSASPSTRARDPEVAERERRQAVLKAEAEAAQRRERAQERERRMRQRIAENEARQKSRGQPAAPLPLPAPLAGASGAK
jgi:hypothetical protein